MSLSLRSVSRIIGLALIVVSLAMLPSLAVAVIYHEMTAFFAFLVTIICFILLGLAFVLYGRKENAKLKVRDGFLIVTLCWIVAAVLGAVPFMVSGAIPNFFDAFFESCSGFSTTGCTILTDIERLPNSILFWRSFTHWIGGMGILVIAIAIVPSLGISGQNIAKSETPGPILDKVTPKMSDTAKALYLVYLFMTILQVILLRLGGMNLFDSLIHTFGSVGTGGLSNYNDSVAHFNSDYIDIVITTFMILAGINFNLYYLALRQGGLRTFWHDSEFRFFMIIQFAATILISLDLRLFGGYDDIGHSTLDSAFQSASVLTTTGFMTQDFNLWPTFSKMILLLLMFVGGCSSSTGGGLKAVRVLVLLKLVRRGIAMRLHPNAIVTVKLNGKTLANDVVSAIANHAFLYLVIVFVSTILIAINNFDLTTSFTSVVTCLGNVGPGFELVGPAANFSIFASPAKLLLSLLMLAGRLELFTMFILFTPRFWNPDH